MDRVLSIPLGVVIAHEKIDHPWQEYAWRPVSVFLNAPEIGDWRRCGAMPLPPVPHGDLPLELHPETIGYVANLDAGEPLVYVVLREGGDERQAHRCGCGDGLSYDAEVYGYDSSEIVDTVLAPAADRAARGVRGRAPRRGAVRQAPAPEAPPGRGAQVRPGAHRGAAPAQRSRERPGMNDEEPFLKRWSRRKIEAKEEAGCSRC